MRVAILGIGSIGGVFLSSLSNADVDLLAISRGPTAQSLISEGLIIHTPEGAIEAIPPERFEVYDSESGPVPENIVGSCDIAIVCGKSYSTPILSQIVGDILSDRGVALSVQNGMGHAQHISSRVGKTRTLGGATTHGAWRDKDGTHWVGRGSITIGSLDGNPPSNSAKALLKVLEDAELSPIWVDDINTSSWEKLLINVAINPICSISGVRNGALLESPGLWDQSLSVLEESLTVARASGINLTFEEMQETLLEVVQSTSDNRCSMLQDLMSGRRTEIDSICGYVIMMGEGLGVPTPLNSMLRALVRGIDDSSQLD
tara:strand:+ start:1849 stop:2799 length:951 start_codon:yes stop_codon:yes gene_type:complete